MNSTVPPALFRALSWGGSAAFLAVALIEWRLGSVYHMLLALGLAGLTFFTSRSQRPTWVAAQLLGLMLAFGIYRILTDYALLRAP